MHKNRIIFMGTPEISLVYLKTLFESGFNIVGVFSQPPRKQGRGMKIKISSVQDFATSKKIKVYTPEELNSDIVKSQIKDLKPDLIVVMGYGLILPKFILQTPYFGCINIHVSLLPRWRGASPIEHAILKGDKNTGVSIIKLEEKLDSGPIIKQKIIKISTKINKGELTSQINKVGTMMLKNIIPKIFSKKIVYKNQNNKDVSYAPKITAEMRKIDFNCDVVEIYNKIRAFSPKPLSWFLLNNERIRIVKATYFKGDYEPSTIINDQFQISCKNGIICPIILQREGKNIVNLDEFLRGYKFKIGSKVNV